MSTEETLQQAAEGQAAVTPPLHPPAITEGDDRTQVFAGADEPTQVARGEAFQDSQVPLIGSDNTQVFLHPTPTAAPVPVKEPVNHICPKCGADNLIDVLKKRNYRCAKCKLEMAYLDYAANGSIRGIFGWLLSPGDIALEHYKVETVLGKGGFGSTYLVSDQHLGGKRRALKEVPELMFDEYEASLLIKLDHPAIPDIIERRAVGGMYYMVLKFGGSRTLGAERKQSPDNRIPEAKLIPWMKQLCEVLIYLHSQTPPIIHRDLKPDNILLNEDERIMLIDFGIAKESLPESLTRTLARAMSPGFSSLEQIIGNRTDERSDIYSLGATFYALLTGLKPPGADERVSGKRLIAPSEVIPQVSPAVEAAIIQSLNLNINDRQQSVREFFDQAFGRYEGSHAARTGEDEPTRAFAGGDGEATIFTPPPSQKGTGYGQPAEVEAESSGGKGGLVGALAALVFVAAGGGYFFMNQTKTVPVEAAKPAVSNVAPAVANPALPPVVVSNATGQGVEGQLATAPAPVTKPAEEQLVDLIPQLKGFPITLSQPRYRERDNIEFTLDLPNPGYLHVFILEPGGKATLIFPNKMVPNNQVQAGKLKLPNGKPPLKASPPYGKSWFIAINEPNPNNLFQQYTQESKKGMLFVELTAWQLLGFLHDRLSNQNTKAAGAEMSVCAKDGPCD